MHLTTIGRKSGRERNVIIAYLEDGPNVTGLAMNGWDEGHPAWWLEPRDQPGRRHPASAPATSPSPRPPCRRRRA